MNKEIILGKEYFGVDLTKDTADEAIFNGVCVQKTITVAGRVSVALKNSSKPVAEIFDDALCFETDSTARMFYNAHRARWQKIGALRERIESRVRKIKDKIFGKPKFPDFIQQ